MNTRSNNQPQLEASIVEYFYNFTASADIAEQVQKSEEETRQILAKYQREWDSAECEAEGPTKKQSQALDRLIEECAAELAA